MSFDGLVGELLAGASTSTSPVSAIDDVADGVRARASFSRPRFVLSLTFFVG